MILRFRLGGSSLAASALAHGALGEVIEAERGNTAGFAPPPMPDPLTRVATAVFGPAPPKRTVRLRPRPPYLPHPIRRLARLRGVIVCRHRRR